MLDLHQHLKRQMAFSRATFGPGERREGLIDHIRKELLEVAACQSAEAAAEEWVDVVILALDGLTRALAQTEAGHYGAAYMAVVKINNKQGRNEERTWPDWRTADPSRATEHLRGTE